MDLELNPETMVRDLDASYKQIVEISRAMLMNARLVIMDEPTTSLTDPEIERVFSFMKRLKNESVGIIFISHKLNEVMAICDSYTVLRDGHMVSTGEICSVSSSDLARMMVGHDIKQNKRSDIMACGKVVLEAKDLCDGEHFKNISFKIHEGEVVGFTGLLGDGRSELFQSIFGAGSQYTGTLLVNGKKARIKSTMQAVEMGIAYVPRNRKENGIVKDLSILENGSLVTMRKCKKGILLDRSRLENEFEKQKNALRIKMGSNDDMITSLSGGNQQKAIIGREITADPDLLIAVQPTRGLDVGAIEFIHEQLVAQRDKGKAVLLVSFELDEIFNLSDKIAVINAGRLIDIVDTNKTDVHSIGLMMAGIKKERDDE